MQELDIGFAALESPAPGTRLPAGRTVLRGWLVPKPGFHFTDVRARAGGREFPGIHGAPRADLAAFFHLEPWRALAEFTVAVDLPPGPTVVSFDARENHGRWQPFLVATLTAEPAAPAAPPPAPPPVQPHELAAQLRLWLRASDRAAADANAAALVAATPWPRMLRDAHPPFHAHLDQPALLAAAPFGQIQVLGWCFHETQPIRRAWITTDLVTLQPLEVGGPTTLDPARFPQFPHARDCRLYGVVPVPSQLPAPLTVRVYAELADGSRHLVLALRTRPLSTEEAKQPYPAYSPARLAQGALALRRAHRTAGLPLAPGALLAAVREVHAEYRREAPPTLRATSARPPQPLATTTPWRRLVVVTHNLNYEGAPLWLLELCQFLHRTHGARFTVLSPHDGRLRAAFEELGAEVRVVAGDALLGTAATSARAIARQAAALAATLDWSDVDVVVANTVVAFWAVPLAHAASRPVLWHLHESTSPAAFFRRGYGPGVLPAVADALRRADTVNFIAAPARTYYERFSTGANFATVPGWIDLARLDTWRSSHDRAAIRARLGYRPDEVVVANVGAVCDRKGQHVFLAAIELLHRRHPALARSARFVAVGARRDPYNDALRGTAATLGLTNVDWVEESATPFDYFLSADLFVGTSYEEAFPRVILEAMGFRLPIIATAVHGIPTMVEAEHEAILVAPGDTEALLNALVRFLGALPEARRWGARARARVERDFRAELVQPRHAALVSGLAASRR